jgi:hypothetical protein
MARYTAGLAGVRRSAFHCGNSRPGWLGSFQRMNWSTAGSRPAADGAGAWAARAPAGGIGSGSGNGTIGCSSICRTSSSWAGGGGASLGSGLGAKPPE